MKNPQVNPANIVIVYYVSFFKYQVQQELSGTLANLCSDVDQVREEIKEECEALVAQHEHLLKAQTRSKTLRNKAGWLAAELDSFSKTFLSSPVAHNGNGAA